MNIPRRSPNEPLTAEILTPDQIAREIYETAEVKLRLAEYALYGYGSRQANPLPEEHLRETFTNYGQLLVPHAFSEGKLDTDLIRTAHDLLIDGANETASMKLGYKPPKSLSDLVLQKVRLRKPTVREISSKENDTYWRQFSADFERHQLQREHSTPVQHATRYVVDQFWQNPGVAFTTLPQAYRWA